MVLESDFGIRQQTEQFYPLTEADWTRINREHDWIHGRPVPSRS